MLIRNDAKQRFCLTYTHFNISCLLWSLPVIIPKEDPQIVLSGVQYSGNEYGLIINPVKGDMLPAYEHPQIRLKTRERFNGRPLFRKALEGAQLLYNASDDPARRVPVFQFRGNILLDLR